MPARDGVVFGCRRSDVLPPQDTARCWRCCQSQAFTSPGLRASAPAVLVSHPMESSSGACASSLSASNLSAGNSIRGVVALSRVICGDKDGSRPTHAVAMARRPGLVAPSPKLRSSGRAHCSPMAKNSFSRWKYSRSIASRERVATPGSARCRRLRPPGENRHEGIDVDALPDSAARSGEFYLRRSTVVGNVRRSFREGPSPLTSRRRL